MFQLSSQTESVFTCLRNHTLQKQTAQNSRWFSILYYSMFGVHLYTNCDNVALKGQYVNFSI